MSQAVRRVRVAVMISGTGSNMAALIDAGSIRTTLTETLSPINAENLKKAHALIETNTARGKIVLEGQGKELLSNPAIRKAYLGAA